jgi:hypothetical protein
MASTGHLQVRYTIRYFNGLFLLQRCSKNSPLKYIIVYLTYNVVVKIVH